MNLTFGIKYHDERVHVVWNIFRRLINDMSVLEYLDMLEMNSILNCMNIANFY